MTHLECVKELVYKFLNESTSVSERQILLYGNKTPFNGNVTLGIIDYVQADYFMADISNLEERGMVYSGIITVLPSGDKRFNELEQRLVEAILFSFPVFNTDYTRTHLHQDWRILRNKLRHPAFEANKIAA